MVTIDSQKTEKKSSLAIIFHHKSQRQNLLIVLYNLQEIKTLIHRGKSIWSINLIHKRQRKNSGRISMIYKRQIIHLLTFFSHSQNTDGKSSHIYIWFTKNRRKLNVQSLWFTKDRKEKFPRNYISLQKSVTKFSDNSL